LTARGFVGLTWDLSAVMLTDFDEHGFLRAQPLGYGGKDAQVEACEIHHPFGFVSRPNDPDLDDDGNVKPGAACTVFYAVDGNSKHAQLSHDPRSVNKYPRLKKGGSCQYGGNGSFASFDGETSTWTLYVPFEFDSAGTPTKAHLVTVGRDGNNKPLLELAHGNGQAITMLDESLVMSGKGGSTFIELLETGGS